MVDVWLVRICKWHPPTPILGAKRFQGKIIVKWDDYLRKFAEEEFADDWYVACLDNNFPEREDAFVHFSLNI